MQVKEAHSNIEFMHARLRGLDLTHTIKDGSVHRAKHTKSSLVDLSPKPMNQSDNVSRNNQSALHRDGLDTSGTNTYFGCMLSLLLHQHTAPMPYKTGILHEESNVPSLPSETPASSIKRPMRSKAVTYSSPWAHEMLLTNCSSCALGFKCYFEVSIRLTTLGTNVKACELLCTPVLPAHVHLRQSSLLSWLRHDDHDKVSPVCISTTSPSRP